MNKDLRSYFRPPVTRRTFLRGAGLAAVGISTAHRALAMGERRELSFIHTHTGERLTALYYDGGAYRPEVLTRVNELLRDFRTETVFPIDPGALDRLHALQAITGRREPFDIICGYRSPLTNAALRRNSHGVAEHSLHMQGRAIDARLQGYPTHQLAALARAQMSGGTGFYRVSDFVHVDTGAVRIWGDPV